MVLLSSCGTNSNFEFNNDNLGFLSLGLTSAQSFNPNADHGKIVKYKLIITGSAITDPIERFYPVDTNEVTIEGFPASSTIRVVIEAININDVCVRRGTSEDILIKGGQNVSSTITINNVPIFANVRDGAIVYNNRFAPKIFAPGEINFELSDLFNGSKSLIEDQVTNLTRFSINVSENDSIMSINAPILSLGTHNLTVEDINSGEASTILITVLDGAQKKALTTTAGNYVGSIMSVNTSWETNFIDYHNFQSGLQ